MKYDLKNIQAGTQEKKLRIGYQMDKAHLCFGVNQNSAASWGRLCGETFLGLFYTGLVNKKIGLQTNMTGCDWKDLKHALVYEANINGKTFKAKVDTD